MLCSGSQPHLVALGLLLVSGAALPAPWQRLKPPRAGGGCSRSSETFAKLWSKIARPLPGVRPEAAPAADVKIKQSQFCSAGEKLLPTTASCLWHEAQPRPLKYMVRAIAPFVSAPRKNTQPRPDAPEHFPLGLALARCAAPVQMRVFKPMV